MSLLRGYKLVISQYFAGSCRFLPSCSDYAREAVISHGTLRGGWLAAQRLARCHPLCEAGHDPVPPVASIGVGTDLRVGPKGGHMGPPRSGANT